MDETAQQYIGRITGYVKGKDHLAVFAATPKNVKQLLKNVTATKLAMKSAPEKWSIAEILAHLAEGEIVLSYRLRSVLGANGTTVQAFDQNAWQENAIYLIKKPADALRLFTVLRQSNVALLRSIPKDRGEYFGMHQERGKETIARMVEMYSGHDVNHLQQIEQLVGRKRQTK